MKIKKTFLYHLWQIIKCPKRKSDYMLIEFHDNMEMTIGRFFEDDYQGFNLIDYCYEFEIINHQLLKTNRDKTKVYSLLVKRKHFYSIWEQNKRWKQTRYLDEKYRKLREQSL